MPRPRVAPDLLDGNRRETLKQMYGESVSIAWLPYDYPGSVRRFVEHFRPRLGC
jgi:3-deoxy-D-manno-octulosonic-acid transferase